MQTLPEHLMIFPVFVKFTLLVVYVCGVRVQSCLFVLSLLFLLSFCVYSIAFLTCDFLDLIISSACCFGIHLPMFHGTFIV
jgi:hypothetical protein